jgi:hypothetical protein
MSDQGMPDAEKHLVALQEYKIVYDAFRDYMKVEHNLQNERSTWHHVIQGFLFATLGVIGQWPAGQPDILKTEKTCLPFILAAAGIWIAKVAYDSIDAADIAISEICKRWTTAIANYPIEIRTTFPEISGGGSPEAERKGRRQVHRMPIIIGLAWISVLFMYSADILIARIKQCSPVAQTNSHPVETKASLMEEYVAADTHSTDLAKQLRDKYAVIIPPCDNNPPAIPKPARKHTKFHGG